MDSTSNENGTTQESGLIDASTSEVSCSDHGDNTESFKGDDDNTADNGGYDRAAATDADRSRAEAGTASPTPTHFSSPKNNGQTTHKSLVWNENDKTPPPSSVRSRDATAPDTHPQQVSWVSAVRSTEPGEYATTTTGRYQIVSTNKKDLKRVEAGPESLESGVTKREQIKDDVKYKNIEPAKRPGAVAYLHNVPQEPQQDDDKEPRNFMSEPNVSRTTTKTPPSDVALAVTTRTTPPRQSSLRDHRKTPCYTESAKPSGEAVINMKEGYKFINRAPPEPGPPVRSSLKSSKSERSGGTTAISSKAPDNITQRRRSSNVTNGACHDKTDWTIRDQAAIVEPSVPSDSSSQHRARASTEQGGAPGTATDFKATNHQGTDGHRASSEKMSLSVSAAAAGIGNAGLLSNTAEKCVNKDGKPSYKQVNSTTHSSARSHPDETGSKFATFPKSAGIKSGAAMTETPRDANVESAVVSLSPNSVPQATYGINVRSSVDKMAPSIQAMIKSSIFRNDGKCGMEPILPFDPNRQSPADQTPGNGTLEMNEGERQEQDNIRVRDASPAASTSPLVPEVDDTEASSSGEGGIAIAVSVDEDAEKGELTKAEEFSEPRTKLRPIFVWLPILLSVFACLCIVAIVVGIVVGKKDKKDLEASGEEILLQQIPTEAPTLAPSTSDEMYLRSWLDEKNISQTTIDHAPIAFDMAIDWYANSDRFRNSSIPGSEYPWDYERFILAWFYFSSSSHGTKPWVSCNPPDYSSGQSDSCTFFEFEQTANDRSYVTYKHVPDTARWLSNNHHCDWPGVTCSWYSFPPESRYFVCSNRAILLLQLIGFGLSGPLSVVVNQFPCLVDLTLSWNSEITGTISPELFNFRPDGLTGSEMQNFVLLNSSRMSGTIPEELWAQPSLRGIALADSNLSGTIPDLNANGLAARLERLWIFGNRFGGALPKLNVESRLKSIRFHRDLVGFIGPIPTEYGALSQLESVWLFDNKLTGPIPSSFSNLRRIQQFRVQRNQLTGSIPNIRWVNATKVELQTNSLEGELPTGLVDMPMLTNLLIEENKLSGTINPDIFNNKTVLRAVWLQDNNFTGPIPSTLANLESLMSLGLNFNNFEGDVPFEICELRSSDGLAFLFADCLGYPPATYCFCCTSCCYRDEDFETCQTTDDAEPDSRRLLTKTKRLESEDHLSKAFYDRLREDVINVIEQNWR